VEPLKKVPAAHSQTRSEVVVGAVFSTSKSSHSVTFTHSPVLVFKYVASGHDTVAVVEFVPSRLRRLGEGVVVDEGEDVVLTAVPLTVVVVEVPFTIVAFVVEKVEEVEEVEEVEDVEEVDVVVVTAENSRLVVNVGTADSNSDSLSQTVTALHSAAFVVVE